MGSGAGVVTGPGISCGAVQYPDCGEVFPAGTQITLNASASGTSVFGAWSGACSGTGPCNVTMDSDKAIVATFNPQMVRDQAYEPGAGSNVQTGRLDKAQTFTVGTTGTLARVDVDILRYPGSASDLLFDLRATIYGAPVASNTNTLVSVRVPHSQAPTTRGFFSINFQNSGVPVTAGTVLAIVLRSDPDVQRYT